MSAQIPPVNLEPQDGDDHTDLSIRGTASLAKIATAMTAESAGDPPVESAGNQGTAIPAGMAHVEIYAADGVDLVYQGIPRPRHFIIEGVPGRGTPLLDSNKITGGNYTWAAWR